MSTFLYLSDGYLLAMGAWLLALAIWPIVAIKRRSRRRAAGKPLGLVHAGLMLWLLLSLLTLPELYFALCYDTTDSFSLTNVSRRWYQIHVPQSALNSAGYRDPRRFTESLPPGEQRICFVGDSFTYGHGVPDVADRFSDRIAVELEAAQTGKFRVANAGRPGRDVRELVDSTVTDWVDRDVQIDVLVYSLVLNDIEYFEERTGRLYQGIEAAKPKFFLFRDTYFYNFVYFRWQQLQQPDVRDYFGYLAESYRGEAWKRMRHKLDELVALCKANDIELRVVIFPFLHNLGPDYPFRDAHQRLVEYFTNKDVPCLDLEPVLSPHATEGLTVNRFDAHPNELAHALAAKAMREKLLNDLFNEQR